MNADEVGKLLGLMALADNRKPPEDEEGRRAMIAFWLSMVGDLSYADAAQAVQAHYRESREWLMPVDVRQRVKAMRTDRLSRTPLPAPDPDLADDPEGYKRAIAEGIGIIADGFDTRKAIGGPLPGDPPEEWQERKAAVTPEQPDKQALALEQAERSRRERAEREASEAGEAEAS